MAIKVTTMIGDNYGSALQAYALQQVIKEIGGGSSVVNLRPKSYVVRFLRTYLIPTKYDGSANLRTLIVRSLNSIVRWIGMQYLRILQVNEKHQ